MIRPARSIGRLVLCLVLSGGSALLTGRVASAGELDPLFAAMQRDYLFGQYATDDAAEQRHAFDRVLATSQRVQERIAARCDLDGTSNDDEIVERLRRDPDGARAELWAAVSWGLYGMSHSKWASATHGVADEIRLHASRLIEIDPDYENGAGYRLLGRLHTSVPRVPFVSSWVDRDRGVELLRRALATSRDDPRNFLFLAEALLDGHTDGEAGQARRDEIESLLLRAAAFTPRPDHRLEDAETIEQAERRLGGLEPPS